MSTHDRLWAVTASVLAAFVLVIAVLQGFAYAWRGIAIGFACEQTQIFADMRLQALESTPSRAADCLSYVVSYYPSGTKQETGSPLDEIVERARQEAVASIIAHLRHTTGDDRGTTAEPWITKYGTHSSSRD